ncbi:dienelactone hydrolase family protein [Saccharicrinis sp. FJH54]|uniref:dienelactone hydrolase family protein n=1 Tax=Saccharicrinis sp. FJH54 TaxID=3344665 RepID=UPI0035D4F224
MKRIVILLLASFSLLTIQAQDFAVKELDASPRHQEWIKVKSGDRDVNCFVVYPETSKKATVVIAIHENRGLTDWVRSFADQLAGKGFIVVAPDLLSDFGPSINGTSDFKTSDEARNAIYALKPDQVMNDLNAVQKYAAQIPSGNGKTAVIGFCWGGTQSFRMATYNQNIKAALVFYGSAPDKKDIANITAPVYGFYGGNDQRINAGIPETETLMRDAGKSYEYVIYDGAGHAYMRQGDDPDGSADNKAARDNSWKRLVKILDEI